MWPLCGITPHLAGVIFSVRTPCGRDFEVCRLLFSIFSFPGTLAVEERSLRAPKKLSRWSPKSPWNVYKSRSFEKVKNCQNHDIYHSLATCSLCAEVDFLQKIVKKMRPEASHQVFYTKKQKSHPHDPNAVPKGGQSGPREHRLGDFAVFWKRSSAWCCVEVLKAAANKRKDCVT
jgi:hypothetical protein